MVKQMYILLTAPLENCGVTQLSAIDASLKIKLTAVSFDGQPIFYSSHHYLSCSTI